MSLRKCIAVFALLCFSTGVVFAGSEDWEGSFTIQDAKGATMLITHSPDHVKAGWATAGNAITFSKNVHMNGFDIAADGTLGVHMNVDTFTAEAAKWGSIVNKEIHLGPSYSA